ncbi:MAG: hypothetical protein KGZ71_09880 [Desulfobulbaceae bacterium]|nr:hypothetical protein [Desulfobulbaceae bacterium]
MIERFLTPNQVAKLLHIHSSKVREEMDNGRLKCKYFGSHRKTTETWVKEWQYQADNQSCSVVQNGRPATNHKSLQKRSVLDVVKNHQRLQLQNN